MNGFKWFEPMAKVFHSKCGSSFLDTALTVQSQSKL